MHINVALQRICVVGGADPVSDCPSQAASTPVLRPRLRRELAASKALPLIGWPLLAALLARMSVASGPDIRSGLFPDIGCIPMLMHRLLIYRLRHGLLSAWYPCNDDRH